MAQGYVATIGGTYQRVCIKELQLLSFFISEGIFVAMLFRKHHGQKLLVERI
jgi:hypothetical protein